MVSIIPYPYTKKPRHRIANIAAPRCSMPHSTVPCCYAARYLSMVRLPAVPPFVGCCGAEEGLSSTIQRYHTYVPYICTIHMYHIHAPYTSTIHMHHTHAPYICTIHVPYICTIQRYHTKVPYKGTIHRYHTYVSYICTIHIYHTYAHTHVPYICTIHMYGTRMVHVRYMY